MIVWSRWGRLGWWIAGVIIMIGSAVWRVAREGRAELLASDVAWSAGDAPEATVHARRAALALVPGAAYVPEAYRRLREIAEQSEARGDPEAALFAWRAIRAAAIGSRSWMSAHEGERASADAAIARLMAARLSPSSGRAPSHETSRAYREQLSADSASMLGYSALLLLGVALWAAGGVRLARRGFDLEGRLRGREARTAALLATAGLVFWVAGLLLW